ncbi:MAG: TolC family protein [Acidobacteria bacterium]|nr:TolC family protein [Acidobacteriota bacterium]
MTKNTKSALILLAVMLLVTSQGSSQEAGKTAPSTPTAQLAPKINLDYTRTAWFPKFYGPYQEPIVPQPPMSNSERLRTMTVGGKLRLSVDDAIALALENNLDIAVARFGPAVAQTDITRAKSGGATRGVAGAFTSQALFAGALGGGITGGGGNLAGSAGGAFATGGATNIGGFSSFDPITGFNFGWDRRSTPLGITLLSGVPFVTTQTSQYQSFFGQRFQTGTSYIFALSGTRQSTTSLTNVFNPQVSTNMLVGLNQPLLSGYGRNANSKFIRISKNNARIADSVFRQEVIRAITQVLNLYYDMVYFRDNVRVAERSLALAEKTLSDNKRQVEIGTLAPIEVVRAESEVAARQQDLIIAQTNLQKQATLLKTALAKQVDADLSGIEIEPTDTLPAPRPEDVPPLDEALRLAFENRPEIEQSDLNLRNQEIVIKANRNSLLPSLDLFGSYSGAGLAGNHCGTPNVPSALCPDPLIMAGGPQALNQSFHGNYPDYSFGLSLTVPIKNRSAQADAVRALLEQRQLQTQMQKTKNQISQEVRNAEISMIQANAQIEASQKAVVLAKQTLDAEQKKFQLGESTVFLVIQAQRDVVAAEVREVQARALYAKALTEFAQATGTTLTKHRIELNDALQGSVSRVPNIPGTPSARMLRNLTDLK